MDEKLFRKVKDYLEEIDKAVETANVANRMIYNKVADLHNFINDVYIMGDDFKY